MEGAPKQFTKEEISELEKSRTISDAGLLRKGAEYVVDDNGNKVGINLTESQNEILNTSHEKITELDYGVPLLKNILEFVHDEEYKSITSGKYNMFDDPWYSISLGGFEILISYDNQYQYGDKNRGKGYLCSINGKVICSKENEADDVVVDFYKKLGKIISENKSL